MKYKERINYIRKAGGVSSKRDLHCPHCGKFVARVSEDARSGSIFPFCKSCKAEVEIPLSD
ncbi:MAG: hypothetical protein LIO93_04195 [Bacteroidales bacterium]|nr:hypothetical protein [Bacteroidales bacterium]